MFDVTEIAARLVFADINFRHSSRKYVCARRLIVNSIECFQESFDLIDIWRVKIRLQKALLGVKTLQRFFAA